MAEPFLSELRIFTFNFPPKGWALCNGQILPINQNQALFALLGTTYGGNGQTTFQLPNLQGRVPMHLGNGFTQGQIGGETSHTLLASELPAHSHQMLASQSNANSTDPTNQALAVTSAPLYKRSLAAATTLNSGALASVGSGQPHANEAPYLVLNVCIALQGIFPSRN